jgi:hypothetical protein
MIQWCPTVFALALGPERLAPLAMVEGRPGQRAGASCVAGKETLMLDAAAKTAQIGDL